MVVPVFITLIAIHGRCVTIKLSYPTTPSYGTGRHPYLLLITYPHHMHYLSFTSRSSGSCFSSPYRTTRNVVVLVHPGAASSSLSKTSPSSSQADLHPTPPSHHHQYRPRPRHRHRPPLLWWVSSITVALFIIKRYALLLSCTCTFNRFEIHLIN
jgi:hypothetical protein